MGETSIPCGESTRDRLDELRGDEYKSWDAFLNHLADVWEQSEPTYEATIPEGSDSGFEDIAEAVETIEERTGRIERTLEDLSRY